MNNLKTGEPEITGSDAARLWATAQALARLAASVRGGEASRVPPLLFFTDPDRTPRPWEVAARMPPGSGVIYRAFSRPDAWQTAERLRAVTSARRMTLLIGLDAELAQAVGADGVHLPERALSAACSLSKLRPDWLLTGAVHSVEAALAARDLDAVVLSPIFAAGGASRHSAPLGHNALGEVSAVRPVIALGGVTADNAGSLLRSGASAIAAVSGIANAFKA